MNNTIKVCLFKRTRPLPGGGKATYWMLKWPGENGCPNTESLGRIEELGIREAKGKRTKKEADLNADRVPRDNPDRMALASFIPMYLEQRKQSETGKGFRKGSRRLDERTIAQHAVTLRYMQHHFGEQRAINSIDDDDAEQFIEALAAGKLAGASKAKRAAGSRSNMAKHVRYVRGIFSWAKKKRLVSVNPFQDFDGTAPKSEPSVYVSESDIEKVIAACPTAAWKAVFGLTRYAGLRIGEAVSLPWEGHAVDKDGTRRWIGVDFAKARLHVVAEKTGKYRVIPVTPRLAAILDEAHAAVVNKAPLICGGLTCGLHHGAQRIIKAAGVKPWVDQWRSLRYSRENDLKVAGVAEPTYTAWMGHGVDVSRKHYVEPQEIEFDAVSKPVLKLAG